MNQQHRCKMTEVVNLFKASKISVKEVMATMDTLKKYPCPSPCLFLHFLHVCFHHQDTKVVCRASHASNISGLFFFYKSLHLLQCFSTFQTLCSFNTVPYLVVTANHKSYFCCNLITVILLL